MNIFSRYVAWSEKLLEKKSLLILFMYINMLGFVVGVSVYERAMENMHPVLWILLVDCPIYPAVMVLILLFRKNNFIQKFYFFTFYGLIKYGLWTIMAWGFYYKELLMASLLINGLIVLGHFGMIFEAGFIARRAAKAKGLEILLPIVWMFGNDFFDYVLGTHPPVPYTKYLIFLLIQNLVLNIAIPVFLFYFLKKKVEENS